MMVKMHQKKSGNVTRYMYLPTFNEQCHHTLAGFNAYPTSVEAPLMLVRGLALRGPKINQKSS